MNARKVKLGDVCTVVSGATPSSKSPEYWNGDVVWITPAELTEDSYIVSDSCRHLTQLGVQSSSLKPFPAGTVILTSRAPIGKTAIAGREMYCNQGFKNLICSPYIYNKYLYCFLTARTQFLNSLGRGATFKELSKSIVENIEIYLPEINTQKFRAEILLKIKLIIQKKKLQLQTLDSLVKSRFVEMFGGVHENPFGWKIIKFSDICDIINGYAFKSEKYVAEGIRIIRITNVQKGYVEDTDPKFYPITYEKELNKFILHSNDILISLTGNVGRVGILPEQMLPAALNQRVACVRIKNKIIINKIFFYSLLNNEVFESDCIASSQGIAQKNMSTEWLKKYPVIIPPKQLQDKFATFVQQVDKSKFLYQFTLKRFTDILFAQRRHLYG